PELKRVAIYEPPLPVDEQDPPDSWAASYEQNLAKGDLAAALVSVLKGTDDSPLSMLPGFVLTRVFRLGINGDAKETQVGDVPIHTMHYDAQIVNKMGGKSGGFKDVRADVLLLGGARSRSFLKSALDYLGKTLPHSKRIEFPGVGHLAADNDGKPEMVAAELK